MKKRGRPKGSKSSGIPVKSVQDAVDLTKKAWEAYGENIMSFGEMSKAMGLPKGAAVKFSGDLFKYGFISKNEDGWIIDDLGKRAVKGDREAIKESFEKNTILRDLSAQFWDKKITPGTVENYLKSKYKKGENVKLIVDRYIHDTEYIRSLKEFKPHDYSKKVEESKDPGLFKLMQLKFAINPPSGEEIDRLVDEVADELKDEDIAIKTLASSIKENKKNRDLLEVLVNNMCQIMSNKYPALISKIFETKKEQKKQVSVKKEKQGSTLSEEPPQ